MNRLVEQKTSEEKQENPFICQKCRFHQPSLHTEKDVFVQGNKMHSSFGFILWSAAESVYRICMAHKCLEVIEMLTERLARFVHELSSE